MTKIHNMSIIFAAGGLQLTCGAILLSWFWPERAFINYNYFTVYKSSTLNLKIVWSKMVSFFVFLRCRKFIRRSHGSSLFVYWEVMPFAFIKMSGWKLIALFIYKSCPVTYKINYYSWFLSRGTIASRLIKWIYKEIGIALTEKNLDSYSKWKTKLQTGQKSPIDGA